MLSARAARPKNRLPISRVAKAALDPKKGTKMLVRGKGGIRQKFIHSFSKRNPNRPRPVVRGRAASAAAVSSSIMWPNKTNGDFLGLSHPLRAVHY